MSDGKEETTDVLAFFFEKFYKYIKEKKDEFSESIDQAIDEFFKENDELAELIKEKGFPLGDVENIKNFDFKDHILEKYWNELEHQASTFDKHNQLALAEVSSAKIGIDPSSKEGIKMLNDLNKLEQHHLQNAFHKTQLLESVSNTLSKEDMEHNNTIENELKNEAEKPMEMQREVIEIQYEEMEYEME